MPTLFGSVDEILTAHSERVLREARLLRDKGVGLRELSMYKRKWELELYRSLLSLFGNNLLLIGKNAGIVGNRDSEWVVLADLLDGSKNFLSYYIPFYSYNVAIAYGDELVFSLCVDLAREEVFKAIKGKGAYVNSKGIEEVRWKSKVDIILSNVPVRHRKFGHFGCSSLDICYVVKGAAKLAIMNTWNVDVAASILVAKESGLKVLNWEFNELSFPVRESRKIKFIVGYSDFIAENKELISEILNNVVE